MLPALILSFSNLLGYPCLIKTTSPFERILILSIMLSSFLMHLTESKHTYHPIILSKYSNFFLWIDRIVAVISILYFLPILFKKEEKIEQVLLLAAVGLIASFLGEQKSNNWYYNHLAYPFLHLIWHACVYQSLYNLV